MAATLLISLGVGIALTFIAFVAIYKFTRLSGKHVAAIVIFAVIGIYVPVSIFSWPGADVFAIHIALYVIVPYGLGIITTNWESRRHEERSGRWFHWGPTTIVVFFLGLVVVDSTIIMLSDRGMSEKMAEWLLPAPRAGGEVTSFFPGTVSHDFQKKESLYNDYLRQLEAQERRGWQLSKGWVQEPQAGEPATFRVVVTDREGEPVEGAEVRVDFLRPSDKRRDARYRLEQTDAGVYEHDIALPLPGIWNVVIEVVKGDDLHQNRGMTSLAEAAAQ